MDTQLEPQEWAEIANVMNEAAEQRAELRPLRDKVRLIAQNAYDNDIQFLLKKFYGERAGRVIWDVSQQEPVARNKVVEE